MLHFKCNLSQQQNTKKTHNMYPVPHYLFMFFLLFMAFGVRFVPDSNAGRSPKKARCMKGTVTGEKIFFLMLR